MAANWRMRQRSAPVKRSRSTGFRSWTTPMTLPRARSGTARIDRVRNSLVGSPCQRGSAATSLTTSALPERATLPTIPSPSGTRRSRMSPAARPRTTRKNSSPWSSSSSQIELVSARQSSSAVSIASSSTVARSSVPESLTLTSSSISYSAKRGSESNAPSLGCRPNLSTIISVLP
jgi:hypothetical protein